MSAVTPVRCRAKNPATCRTHGIPLSGSLAVLSVADLASSYQDKVESAVAEVKSNAAVEGSLRSGLEWEGAVPPWWDGFSVAAEGHEFYPVTPELLNVVDSPVGGLAVVYMGHSHADTDKWMGLDSGFRVRSLQLRSMESGEMVGYVNFTHATEEAVDRSFGTDEYREFRFVSRYGGEKYYFLEDVKDSASLDSAEKDALDLKVWQRFASSREYVGAWRSKSWGETPQPEDVGQVRRELEAARELLRPQVTQFLEERTVPHIDYSNLLDDRLKGKGFGSAMYIYASRRLAKEGLKLRASGIQSDEAQGLWDRFKRILPGRVKSGVGKYRGEDYAALYLDFTD